MFINLKELFVKKVTKWCDDTKISNKQLVAQWAKSSHSIYVTNTNMVAQKKYKKSENHKSAHTDSCSCVKGEFVGSVSC